MFQSQRLDRNILHWPLPKQPKHKGKTEFRQEVLGNLGNMGKQNSRTQEVKMHYVILAWMGRGGVWNSTSE